MPGLSHSRSRLRSTSVVPRESDQLPGLLNALMDGAIDKTNGAYFTSPVVVRSQVDRPGSRGTSKQPTSTPTERQKLYNSISDSTSGIRRYSAGDSRRPTATLRNISHSSRMGYPSSVPRNDTAMETLDEETARDPRDTASPLTPVSPTPSNGIYADRPTVDFDGLSWPSA